MLKWTETSSKAELARQKEAHQLDLESVDPKSLSLLGAGPRNLKGGVLEETQPVSEVGVTAFCRRGVTNCLQV